MWYPAAGEAGKENALQAAAYRADEGVEIDDDILWPLHPQCNISTACRQCRVQKALHFDSAAHAAGRTRVSQTAHFLLSGSRNSAFRIFSCLASRFLAICCCGRTSAAAPQRRFSAHMMLVIALPGEM